VQTSRDRFSGPAIILHWAIAGLILCNIYLGLKMDGLTSAADGSLRVEVVRLGGFYLGWTLERGSAALLRFQTFQLHKSIGFTILLLSVLRLLWRLVHRPPPYPPHMSALDRAAASTVHWAFYFIMIAMPLTGWVIVSASPTNIPTLLYKAVPFPHLGFVHDLPMATRRALEDRVGDVHQVLAWTTITLFFLHVGAALKHQFWDKDGVLYRMAPFLRFGARP
jgi:cytochrome b561